jgi:hypothetical protein
MTVQGQKPVEKKPYVGRSILYTAPSIREKSEGNCIYGGNALGHSKGFCTADACY